MGITLRNPSQEDFNQLKRMLADGIITADQLANMPTDVSYDTKRPALDSAATNMLSKMMQTQSAQNQNDDEFTQNLPSSQNNPLVKSISIGQDDVQKNNDLVYSEFFTAGQ